MNSSTTPTAVRIADLLERIANGESVQLGAFGDAGTSTPADEDAAFLRDLADGLAKSESSGPAVTDEHLATVALRAVYDDGYRAGQAAWSARDAKYRAGVQLDMARQALSVALRLTGTDAYYAAQVALRALATTPMSHLDLVVLDLLGKAIEHDPRRERGGTLDRNGAQAALGLVEANCARLAV